MFVLNGYRNKEGKTVGSKYYVGDFETSLTDNTESEVFVYATGFMSVDNFDILYYNTNIESFIEDLYKLPSSCSIIYFHNLSFDVEFILNFLMNKKGFTQLLNTYSEKNGFKVIEGRNKGKDKPVNTFEVVYANGSFYQVTLYLDYEEFKDNNGNIKTQQRKIVFRDSYKIASFPLVKIAKDFLGKTIPKDGIDHTIIRKRDYILKPEEIKYLYDDVKTLKDFVKLTVIDGIEVNNEFKVYLNKMTIASQSLSQFKDFLLDDFSTNNYNYCKAFEDRLKDIERDDKRKENDNSFKERLFLQVFPEIDYKDDLFLRRSYFGGIVYKHEDNINKINGCIHGLVYDVNSLYPYVMRTKFLPYGKPVKYYGKYEDSGVDKKLYPLYIQEIQVEKFSLKEGFIPNVQIRDSIHFSSTEYAKDNSYTALGKKYHEPITFVFTSVQLDYFLKSYNVIGLQYGKGYAFKGSYGLFNKYIDTFMEMKKEGKGAVRSTAKLFLNSLYGKFGTNPVREERIIQYEEGVFSTTSINKDGELLEYVEKSIYLPLASFITSYAREVLLTSIEPVYERFLYCDTDSIHIYGYEIPDINIHDKNLGAWKCEGQFDEAKYIGAKRYAEKINGKWDIKCCGLSREIMAQLDIDIFNVCELNKREIEGLYTKDDIFYYHDPECTLKASGVVRSKKKKYIKGGIIIKEQPYMITEKTRMF